MYDEKRYATINVNLANEFASLVSRVKSPDALGRLLRVYCHAIDKTLDDAISDMDADGPRRAAGAGE
jgi:hypothetical protein